MDVGSQPRQSNKHSIRYRHNLLEGAIFELADFDKESHATVSSENKKENPKNSESESSEIMSTSELVSALGSLWDSTARPLTHILSTASSRCNNTDPRNSVYHSIPVNVDSDTDSSPLVLQNNVEFVRAKQKVSFFGPLFEYSSLWEAIDHADELQSVYGRMHDVSLLKFKHRLKPAKFTSHDIGKYTVENARNTIVNHEIDRVSTSTLSPGHYNEFLSDKNSENYDSATEEKVELAGKLDSEVENSLTKEKPRYGLAKQEHAFAGAMAGIFVSLCLHPVDTIKTVVQSCHNDQKPLYYISRSIISERGVTALYRGIYTNLASSAPISALYTFTYESVKGALLPLFPKEYHSFAHCLAGGCASVATSFIFTPSERIKQQMQVGLHYKNCWNALIEIVKGGGLPSLYAGWGAVLCRNIPHSIIKFYTYERLKELRLSSVQLSNQNDTLMTLVSGGLAGSTAALFTTPFDVVKTRLQTQIPGSGTHFGVFYTLKEIGTREGLKGLYRGLSPRLFMYMTQGALFFASYESFKGLLSLEIPQPKAKTVTHEQILEDDPAKSPSSN